MFNYASDNYFQILLFAVLSDKGENGGDHSHGNDHHSHDDNHSHDDHHSHDTEDNTFISTYLGAIIGGSLLFVMLAILIGVVAYLKHWRKK